MRLANSKSDARRLASRIPACGMWPVTVECLGVESLKIDPIVSQYGSGMGHGEGELLAIRPAQILGFPGGQHIKAMCADQVRYEHRHVFIQVQAEKQ